MLRNLVSTIVLLSAFPGCLAQSQQQPTRGAGKPALSSAAMLSEHPPIGELGLPLGTVVEIEATIIAGRELGNKANDGLYLLRVTDVAGRALPGAPVLTFSVPTFVRVNLAGDEFALRELKTGGKDQPLTAEQIQSLEKGYVSKHVRLIVYETGGFSGIPKHLPADVPAWQDRRFGFSTSLVCLAERS